MKPDGHVMTEKDCPVCGATFFQASNGKPQTCSRRCARIRQWDRRKPKDRIPGPSGYYWRLVPNDHPYGLLPGGGKQRRHKYILEHRWVMEQVLGRYLDPRERVHHKNGKRDDNRPENLELWTLDHKDPPGIRVRDKVLDNLLKQPEIITLPEEYKSGVISALKRVFRVKK